MESPLGKIWRVIYPALLYFAVYFLIYLGAICILGSIQSIGMTGIDSAMSTYSGYISMLSLIICLPIAWVLYRRDIVLHTWYVTRHWTTLLVLILIGMLWSHGLSILVSCMNIDNLIGSYEAVETTYYAQDIIVTVVRSVLLAPVAEELIFRGLIFSRMEKYTNFWLAALVSAGLFGLSHLNLAQGVFAFLFGLMLCAVYRLFRNLIAPMVLHAGGNAITLVLQYSGFGLPRLWMYLLDMGICLAAAVLLYLFVLRPKKDRIDVEFQEDIYK